MHSTTKTFKTISLIGAFVFATTTARAVTPAPDGGYPNFNTAEGEDALFSLTIGTDNTAVGFHALYSNTTGYWNTATGVNVLSSNISGGFNTATGVNVLSSNTFGDANTANGAGALQNNIGGNENTANGVNALFSNTNGIWSTATGAFALQSNTIGSSNTAAGRSALGSNTIGSSNTAAGAFVLNRNITGSNNTATGANALLSNTTGSSNIALGDSAGANLTTGSNNIDIGNAGVAGESGAIRIGTAGTQAATFIAGIRETPIAVGVAVGITADGQLGVRASSARFKEAIKPMDKASEAILTLRPVTFHYKKELDPVGTPQFGLVAEQVAKIDPDLVACDADGKPYTVRYEAVNAMLLNEFLKAHATIGELKSVVAKQQEQITALASQIKTVSNRLELSGGAPRVAASEP